MREKAHRARTRSSKQGLVKVRGVAHISRGSLQCLARWLICVVLVGMPFHALIVIVLGHAFGGQLLFASWKEVVIVLLSILAVLLSFVTGFGWIRRPANLMVAIIGVAGLIGVALSGRSDFSWLAGIKTTLLPLVLFVAVQPFADQLNWQKIRGLVLIPALVVSGIALVQFLITPTLFLQMLGYGPTTINPYQTVLIGSDLGRSFATLGGPNQLGAYLMLPTLWFLALGVTARNRQMRLIAAFAAAVTTLAILTSFSRSALLGLFGGLIVLFGLYIPRRFQVVAAAGGIVSAVIGWLKIQQLARIPGSFVQTYLIRGQVNDSGMIIGSDEGHIYAWQQGLELAARHPLGLGFGAAGPASKYGSAYTITENWYVQIVLELGWLGALAFGILFIELTRRWWLSEDRVSKVLLASLFAILVANAFLHTFADSTLSIVWWTLAGLSYGGGRVRGHDGA